MNEAREKDSLLRAVLLNALFLTAVLLVFRPYYELNDDVLLQQLVDGELGQSYCRLLYINVVLGGVLKLLYALLPGLPWYALLQYLLLFGSFTAMSWVSLRRAERPLPALLMSLILLCICGTSAYVAIQYTKTSAVATAGGLFLLLYAADSGGRQTMPKLLGLALALCGALLRKNAFLSVGAGIAPIVLDPLLAALRGKQSAGQRFAAVCRVISPFALLLLLFGALQIVDRLAFTSPEWEQYVEYNAARVEVIDYYLPDYERYRDEYTELGISESLKRLIDRANYNEPDLLGTAALQALARLRPEGGDLTSALRDLLHICAPEYLRHWAFANLAVFGLLWLLFGRHDTAAWLSVAGAALVFLGFALYLCVLGRYNVKHVDYSLLLSPCIVLLWYTPKRARNASGWRFPAVALTAAAVTIGVYLSIGGGWHYDELVLGNTEAAEFDRQKAVYQTLSEDEHLIVADVELLTEYYRAYGPFERPLNGLWDHVVLLGGWQTNRPEQREIMAGYGISNPYRDIVGNEAVRLLASNVGPIMEYINEQYSPDAVCIPLYTLDDRTGMVVYSVVNAEK